MNDEHDKRTKLTVKLIAPIYRDFDRQTARNLLKRDAFLERVIAQELPHLRRDLAGKRLSQPAKRYISGQLKRLGGERAGLLQVVSISINHKVAKELAAVVEEHNLVRDAFINRLIVLLRSSNALLNALGLPYSVSSLRRDGSADAATSPMGAIEELLTDPFYYLRAACEHRYRCGLNVLEFPENLHGLYCYIPDEELPGVVRETVDLSILDEQVEAFESSLKARNLSTTGG